MKIQKIIESQNSLLSMIHEKLPEIKHCEKLLKKHLPEKLDPHYWVSNFHEGIITITVANAETATFLRYQKAELIQKLRAEEKMTSLRNIEFLSAPAHMRKTFSEASSSITKRTVSKDTCNTVDLTAEYCNEPILKAALERLGKTLRKLSTE